MDTVINQKLHPPFRDFCINPSAAFWPNKYLQKQAYRSSTLATHERTPRGEPFQAKPQLSRPHCAKLNFGASCCKTTMAKAGTTLKKTKKKKNTLPAAGYHNLTFPDRPVSVPSLHLFDVKAIWGKREHMVLRNGLHQRVSVCSLDLKRLTVWFMILLPLLCAGPAHWGAHSAIKSVQTVQGSSSQLEAR